MFFRVINSEQQEGAHSVGWDQFTPDLMSNEEKCNLFTRNRAFGPNYFIMYLT